MKLQPASNIKCYALKVLYELECFPWHIEGPVTIAALTGGQYEWNGKWGRVDKGRPTLYAGYCEPPPRGSFLSDLERLVRHFQGEDKETPYQKPEARRTALNRWMTKLTMQPKLYSEAVKEYARISV